MASEDYKDSILENLLHPAKSLFSLKKLVRKILVFENMNFNHPSDLAFSGLEMRYSNEIPKKEIHPS